MSVSKAKSLQLNYLSNLEFVYPLIITILVLLIIGVAMLVFRASGLMTKHKPGLYVADVLSPTTDNGVASSSVLFKSVYLDVVKESSAMIVWETDKPADGQVEFGHNPNSLSAVMPAGNGFVSNQRTLIDGLQSNQRYYFRVKATGADGSINTSDIYNFKTD